MNAQIDLTKIISLAFMLLSATVTYFIIPYLKAKKEEADKEKTAAELEEEAQKLDTIRNWVRIGIMAAEMIFRESGMGQEKYTYVFDYVQKLINEKGYSYNVQEIKMLIESEVLELKNNLIEST